MTRWILAIKSGFIKGVQALTLLAVFLTLVSMLDGPIRELEGYLKPYQLRLLGGTLAMAGLGFALMMEGVLGLFIARRPSKSEGFTVQAMKQAWRSGAWLRNPQWRRRFITVAGGVLMIFGIFSSFFVIGPPWVKLLGGGAMLYILACLIWAFWHA